MRVWVCRVLLLGWLGFVLAGLHLPAPSGVAPENQEAVRDVWRGAGAVLAIPGALVPDLARQWLSVLADDKVLHVLLFVPAGFLWSLARRWSGRRAGRVVLPGLLLLAVASEVLQTQQGRIGDPFDVLANAVGAGMGWLLVRLLSR